MGADGKWVGERVDGKGILVRTLITMYCNFERGIYHWKLGAKSGTVFLKA